MKIRPDGSDATLLVPGNRIEPDVSPDGRYVAFVAGLADEHATLSVARLADGSRVPFEIALPPWTAGNNIDDGRCRWLPNGRGLAYIGREPDGTYGVYLQEFPPGADTRRSRRRVAGFEAGTDAESLGLSADGAYLTVSFREQLFDLMLAENVPDIGRPPPRR